MGRDRRGTDQGGGAGFLTALTNSLRILSTLHGSDKIRLLERSDEALGSIWFYSVPILQLLVKSWVLAQEGDFMRILMLSLLTIVGSLSTAAVAGEKCPQQYSPIEYVCGKDKVLQELGLFRTEPIAYEYTYGFLVTDIADLASPTPDVTLCVGRSEYYVICGSHVAPVPFDDPTIVK